MHNLVELRGVGKAERAKVLDSGAPSLDGGLEFDEQQRLYAVRDALQRESLSRGKTMSELRYAVRAE